MGTHPIFESNFDCLTDFLKMSAPAAKKQKLQVYQDEELFETVNKVQEQLEQVNEKASEEILKVEQRYNKQRRPLFASRQAAIEKLDKSAKDNGERFWARALANHPFLAPMMTNEELQIMKTLTKIEVEEDDDIKSGFSIRFHFAQNEHFANDVIEKKFHIDGEGVVKNETTEIKWKKGKNITENKDVDAEFITWLQETSEDNTDDVADLIKDDLWQNPGQYYLGIEDSDEEDDDG